MSAATKVLLQFAKVQIKCQKHNRQNNSHNRQRRDGEKCQLGDGSEAELENAFGDGDDIVMPFDCHAVWTSEI